MTLPTARCRTLLVAFAALALVACENPMKKKEEEIAKSTFACSYNGERFVVRFAEGEARMLLPELQRVTLYQLPSSSGVRDGVVTPLKDCEPYAVMPPAK